MSEQTMRDPRVDPRAGDVVEQPRYDVQVIPETNKFHVTKRVGDVVHYKFNYCDGFRTSIANWRIGRATATIIHVAEGQGICGSSSS